MFKKKKSNAKENSSGNGVNSKRLQPIHLPSYCTQESRVNTVPSTEMRLLSKTMELQKEVSCSKKNISRKTTSRTMKMQSSLRPSHLKALFKKVKQIKMNPVTELSRSKSPKAGRSKSNNKIGYKNKSDNRLTLKIDSTLRNIDFCQLFHDQESNIVYPSVSHRQQPSSSFSSLEEMEEINFQEMRMFTVAAEPSERLKVQMKSRDSLQQTMAAIAIQRAWRNYRTKKLVERYAKNHFSSIFGENHESNSEASRVSDRFAKLSAHQQDFVVVPSDDFYGENVQDVRQISNLQEEEGVEDSLEDKVKSIKMEELQKWNQILQMIQSSQSSSQAEKQKIFIQIAKQSERNRQELMSLTQQVQRQMRKEGRKKQKQHKVVVVSAEVVGSRNKQPENRQIGSIDAVNEDQPRPVLNGRDLMDSGKRTKNEDQSESENERYNANKYIEYLNGDVFPEDNKEENGKIGNIAVGTISSRKKEMLLKSLKSKPVRLGECSHVSSLSLINLRDVEKEQPQAARHRGNVRRSTSQKMLRRRRSDLNELENEAKIQLQMLAEQYLEAYPMLIEENEEQNYGVQFPPNFSGQLQQEKKLQSPEEYSLEDNKCLQQSINSVLQNLAESSSVGDVGQDSFEQEEKPVQEETNFQKVDNLAGFIISSLVLEFFKDASSSGALIEAIKKFTGNLKFKVRRSVEGQKKKRGFPTDKKEIQLFLQNFTAFIAREQIGLLSNLQVPTGPTAIEMLRYMHASQQESLSQKSDSEQPNIMVIPNRVFDIFWKIKEKAIIVQVPASFTEQHSLVFRQNIEYLKSFNKIFYRSLFDTFNECLDYERNFGVLGRPFPWKKTSFFKHSLTDQEKKASLERARTRMVTLATTYCGLILDSEDIGAVDSEDYLQQVQQDRLSRMLASDLLDNQPRWQFYDDEEAEILIEISNVLYRELLFQVLQELIDFQ